MTMLSVKLPEKSFANLTITDIRKRCRDQKVEGRDNIKQADAYRHINDDFLGTPDFPVDGVVHATLLAVFCVPKFHVPEAIR